ncbi:MAG: hypothetical protein NTW59_04385, partial [Candidatus Diapherotrites archaeon]|nr:hypothetical protein [Candidatus Diapherotrites archaeon]
LLRYNELQSLPKPYADLSGVQRLCYSLQSNVREFLAGQEAVQAAEQSFAEAGRLLSTLRLANARDSAVASDAGLRDFESDFAYFQGFFSGGSLLPDKAMPIIDEFQSGLARLAGDLRAAVGEAARRFAEKNAVVSFRQLDGGGEIVSVELYNPFPEIAGALTVEVPVDAPVGSLLLSTPNVIGLRRNGSKLIVDLNGLPSGKTMLQFSTAETVEVSEGAAEIVSMSESQALASKRVSVRCKQQLPAVQVKVTLLDSNSLFFDKIIVSLGGSQVQHLQYGNSISFVLQNCSGAQEATVQFSVAQPLSLSVSLLDEKQNPAGNAVLSYNLDIYNRMPITSPKGAMISVPMRIDENSILGIELLNSGGGNEEFSLTPGGKIAFELPSALQALQGVGFFIVITGRSGAIPGAVLLQAAADQNYGAGSAKDAAQNLQQQLELLGAGIADAEKKISALEKIFAGASERDLIAAKYIPPISSAELDRLKLRLKDLSAALAKKSVLDFYALSEKGDFNGAMQKATQFQGNLPAQQQELQQINSELENALNAVKEDAFSSYNSATALFNNGTGGSEAEAELEKAKEALGEKDYLAAVVASKKAAGLMALPPAKVGIDFPVLLLPCGIAIAAVVAVRFRKKKRAKQRGRQVRKILRGWSEE